MRALFVLCLVAASGFAQCFKLAEVNAEKPEGQLLQQIGQESDEAKRLPLLEKFVAEYPQHEASGWVYEQLQAAYIKAGNPDKVIEVSEKIAALNPDCVELSHQALKAAETKKDVALIKKWSGRTSEGALKVVASPQPKEEDEVAHWKNRVDYARQVNTYTEYSLYAAALQAADPQQKIDLIETLEKRNPKSEYLPKAYGQLFMAYRQSKAEDKAVALAERVLATDQSDPDMLLVMANHYVQQKKEPEKVHAYCAKAAQIVAGQAKPEGVADADWQKRQSLLAGTAHFISGSLYYAQNKFAQADQELRAALPSIEGNAALKAEALYYLGHANYKLEKAQDAANFFRACGAIKSRYQALAQKNLRAVKAEYTGIK